MLLALIRFCIPIFLLQSQLLQATELGLGLSAVEEGDDRLRPAVLAHVGIDDLGSVRFHHYGRKFGPVTERSYILSANYKLDVFRPFHWDFMHGSVGIAALVEQINIRVPGDNDAQTNLNLGFNFGFFADAPFMPKRILLRFGWESHIFPAGLAAIFLANGRKQVVSLTTGVNL